MNVRQQHRLMVWAAVVIAVGGIVVLAAGLLVAVDVPTKAEVGPSATNRMPTSGPATAEGTSQKTLTLDELQQLCARDYRMPLYEHPASTMPQAGPNALVPLTVQVLGTVCEPSHSMAILRKSDGSVDSYGEQQKVDGAGGDLTVLKIDHQKVTVLYNGQTYELIVPQVP